jgi:hypothetical protein
VNDNCPNCLHRGVEPRSVAEIARGVERSSYRCPRCRRTWETERMADDGRRGEAAGCGDPDAWEADDDFSDYDGPAHDPRYGEPPW